MTAGPLHRTGRSHTSAADFSIVIVTWNSGSDLANLLDSVSEHLPGGPEVVVVDNCSSDGSVAAAENWEGGARVLSMPTNVGFGTANNAGVQACQTDTLVLLNPDTLLVDASLGALADAARRSRALLGPRLLNPDGSWQPSASAPPGGPAETLRLLLPGPLMPGALKARAEPWRMKTRTKVGWLTGACVAGRRDVLLALGPFNEDLHLYGEDMDLGLRAEAAGIDSLFAPDLCQVVHLGGRSAEVRFDDSGLRARIAARRRRRSAGSGTPARALGRGRGTRLPRDPLPGQARAAASSRKGAGLARGERAPPQGFAPLGTGQDLNRVPRRVARPKVIAVFHLSEPSGPLRTLLPRLEWLARRADVEVVFPGPGAGPDLTRDLGTVIAMDYQALTVPAGLSQLARAARRGVREFRSFRRLLRARRPDLVIVASTTLPAVVLAARTQGIPTILEASELLVPGGRTMTPRALVKRVVLVTSAALADAVVACSDPVARQFRRRQRARVITVHPGIAESADGDRDRCRDRLGIASAEFCLVAVGSLSAGRGQDILLRALPLIRAEIPSCRCVIVGKPHPRPIDRAYAASLPALARELGVQSAVTFRETVDPITDAYAAADVVVNPASFANEAFGRVAFEALAAGRPVVSTRDGAVPELLRDGADALLVEPGSPEAIATAVVTLFRDPDRAASLMSTGRRRAHEQFSVERSVRGYAGVVEPLLPPS